MDTDTADQTYYDTLHVQPSAPKAIIKNAYRAMMLGMKYHPDLGGDSERAALINLAYETLSNNKKRADYDQMLAERGGSSASQNPGSDAPQEAAKSQYSNSSDDSTVGNSNSKNSEPNPHREYVNDNGTRCAFCYKFQCIPASEMMDCAGCGSPLDPPSASFATSDAARSIERIVKDTDIQIVDNLRSQPKRASLKDLSPQGLGFVLNDQLSPQQVIRVGCARFEGLATVAHIRSAENGSNFYGAQFISLRFHNSSGNFISTRL